MYPFLIFTLKNSLREKCPNTEFFLARFFAAFELNTERYEVSLRIQLECGKIRTRKSSVFGHILRSELKLTKIEKQAKLLFFQFFCMLSFVNFDDVTISTFYFLCRFKNLQIVDQVKNLILSQKNYCIFS